MSSGRETHPKREVLGLLQSVEKRLIETCANAGFQCENIVLKRHFISSHFFTSCCAFAESALQRLLVLFFFKDIVFQMSRLCRYILNLHVLLFL